MTKERIAGLRELLDKATPGEWVGVLTTSIHDGSESASVSTRERANVGECPVFTIAECGPNDEASRNDAIFIAALKNAAPELLSLAEKGMEAENGKEAPGRGGGDEGMKDKDNIKVGDWVSVNDPGLVMLAKLAPPGSRPINVARVYMIDDDDIWVAFPVGDDPIEVHSQASFYKLGELTVIDAPEWYRHPSLGSE